MEPVSKLALVQQYLRNIEEKKSELSCFTWHLKERYSFDDAVVAAERKIAAAQVINPRFPVVEKP